MPYGRRSSKRRSSSSRRSSYSRGSYSGSRNYSAPRRKRGSAKRGLSGRQRQQVVKLVIEHMMPTDMQRPQLVQPAADVHDKNKKKTF